MEKIVKASTLENNYEYVPYMFAWNTHFQGFIHAPYNKIHELFKLKYFTEVFTLSDGEKIALIWYEEP